jgi:hypothetical protein
VSSSRALAVLSALILAMPCAVASAAGVPARFAVDFGYDARLGHVTPMTLDVWIDPSLPPLTEFRLLTPAGISLIDSKLGATTCRRPESEISLVMNPVRHARCPGNSLMGTGVATAGLVLSEAQTIFGAARISLHAGPTVDGKPGLLVTADTYNPARIQLTYAGYLYVPPEPFGLGMAIKVPPIPHPPLGAPVALSTLNLTVGSEDITYRRNVHGRSASYHPGGIPLPATCPAGGFHFRALMRFSESPIRLSVDSFAPCPPA